MGGPCAWLLDFMLLRLLFKSTWDHSVSILLWVLKALLREISFMVTLCCIAGGRYVVRCRIVAFLETPENI